MTEPLERLFAYGTLMPSEHNHQRIVEYVRSARPGMIQGTLIDLGAFPALVHAEGLVRGVLLDVAPAAFQVADFIEGYDPGRKHSLYLRERVVVDVGDGVTVEAWTYFFARPENIGDRPKLVAGRIGDTPVYAWRPQDRSSFA